MRRLIAFMLVVSAAAFSQNGPGDFLDLGKLPYLKGSRLMQISSNDTTGGNADYMPIGIGETKVLADIKGSGVVTRIWVTISAEDRYFLRRLLLRMYWDGEKDPSVECPVGDFFGNGFSYTQWTSLPLGMSSGGYYCYFPMPFSKGARIELVNESPMKVPSFYYHIDYQKLDSLAGPETGRFHCQWRREIRTDPKQNYLILDARGRGQFVGTILEMQGYGEKDISFLEGDEMVYVDGEQEASIRGTGTEDYFTSGWYFNRGTYSAPFHGLIVKDDTALSRIVAYRFHIGDQILFRSSIRFTIEHGHANEEPGDYSSVAFWYQTEPHRPFGPIMSAARRIPIRIVVPAGAVEAEDLKDRSSASGGELAVEDMTEKGPDWSGDRQMVFRAEGKGSSCDLVFPVKEPDIYRISAYMTKGPRYGKGEVLIAGTKVAEFDCYAPETAPAGRVEFKKVRLLGERGTVVFRVTGKDSSSLGYDVGVDALVLAPERNFLRDWYVIGPFDNPGNDRSRAGLSAVYGPERAIELKKPLTGKDRRPVLWKRYSAGADGFVNLNDALSPHEMAVGYAVGYIHSPAKRDIRIYLGSDDGVRLWLNGRLIADHFILRGAVPDQDTVSAQIREGWNTLLVKIENNLGGWGFYCRIPDPLGDLTIGAEKGPAKKTK